MIKLLLALAFVFVPMTSQAGVFVSVNFAPPPIPVYDQPVCPDDGYLWTPGYWGYSPDGYYWVPGVWVQPPGFGLLWTPGYWGWGNGAYFFHGGYWGPHVGFYGGINYGFGYGGNGFHGGEWRGGHFFYNTAYAHVNHGNIHNTYVNKTVINNNGSRTSFNGGKGGIQAHPTAEQQSFANEHHESATSAQRSHLEAASKDRNQFAKVNGGKPHTLASERPGSMGGKTEGTAKTNENQAGEDHTGEEHHTENLPKEHPETHVGTTKPEEHHTVNHTGSGGEHHAQTHTVQHTQQHAQHPQQHAGPKPGGHPQGGGDHKDKH